VSVTEADLRHIASLARLGLPEERVSALLGELNRILEHMSVLARVDTESVQPIGGVGAAGMPLRADAGEPIPLGVPREAFAPAMRDGFYLVPRLATHEDGGAEAS